MSKSINPYAIVFLVIGELFLISAIFEFVFILLTSLTTDELRYAFLVLGVSYVVGISFAFLITKWLNNISILNNPTYITAIIISGILLPLLFLISLDSYKLIFGQIDGSFSDNGWDLARNCLIGLITVSFVRILNTDEKTKSA